MPFSGLPTSLCAVLTERGYSAPTPVQAAVLPFALGGHDVAGQAPTGSGKIPKILIAHMIGRCQSVLGEHDTGEIQ